MVAILDYGSTSLFLFPVLFVYIDSQSLSLCTLTPSPSICSLLTAFFLMGTAMYWTISAPSKCTLSLINLCSNDQVMQRMKILCCCVEGESYYSTMVVTFWPIRLLKRRLINDLSNLQVIYQPANAAHTFSGQSNWCQLSNFPNSCVASSLLQEELWFLCLARERLLQ